MKKLTDFNSYNVNEASLFPSNVKNWIDDSATGSQTSAAKKVAGWVTKAGSRICGGTSIGKSPQTLILDIKPNGSEIYINANGVIQFLAQEIDNLKDFKTAFEVYKRSSAENKKWFKIVDKVEENIVNEALKSGYEKAELMRMLQPIMDQVYNATFTEEARAEGIDDKDEQILAHIISRVFEWDATSIYLTAAYALEDANDHDGYEALMKMAND